MKTSPLTYFCYHHWQYLFPKFIFASFVQKTSLSDKSLSMWSQTPWIKFICVVFVAGIKEKLFQSTKSSHRQMSLPLKCSFWLILYKKSTLSDPSLRKWAWHSLNFIYLCYFHRGYYGEVVLKLQTLRWKNIFTIEMCAFLLILYKKPILRDRSFKKQAWHSFNFVCLCYIQRGKLF